MGASTLYFNSVTSFHDRRIKAEAEENAQLILDMMSDDIRMMGNGLPDQANWSGPGEIYAVPMPEDHIDVDTITMRLSRTGEVTVNTIDVTPNDGGFTIELLQNFFEAGDRVFMSSVSVGDEYGLAGYVSSYSGETLTLADISTAETAPSYSTGAVFKDGSLVYNIPYVQYDSPSDWSGVTMSIGSIVDDLPSSASIMAPNTTFEIEYLDSNLDTLSALKHDDIMNTLAVVKITVFARGSKSLTNGTTYETYAQKYVAPRYLTIHRQQYWY